MASSSIAAVLASRFRPSSTLLTTTFAAISRCPAVTAAAAAGGGGGGALERDGPSSTYASGLSSGAFNLQAFRCFGGYRRAKGPVNSPTSNFAPFPQTPYGIKKSGAFRDAKKAARKTAERARRSLEEKGMILDPKRQLRMELKRNTGIGWYRSMQIIKHLEMHERGKGPPIDEAMREKITAIARVVRMGK
eukprot:TRINITY_DN7409_c0_g1_i1.p1 TRINITY_DN7409_c0_g1~~TRINITY_DN7409_c0_g1_i1.p1  ORF type:complete len:191 (-),score=42.50 TRINITY_DN7409_c0_g1_i1:119-691(-)